MAERARASGHSFGTRLSALVLGLGAIVSCTTESVALGGQVAESTVSFTPRTKVSSKADRWYLNGEVTYPGTRAEGLLMNVRMVNSVFEDRHKPDFDPEANTNRFLSHVPEYAAHGVRAFTICLQGGRPRYEGFLNSAFTPDGSLRESYLARVRRVIEACDRLGLVVILGCFYQMQDQVLKDENALRAAVTNAAGWIRKCGFQNVVLEITNEKYGKPIVCNEDDKLNDTAARSAELCVTNGASWGFMANAVNQRYPFRFEGARDDPVVYAKFKELTSPRSRPASEWDDYFPPPESQGGWRKLNDPDSIRTVAGMDPGKLTNLRAWLRDSDERGFAAVVIRHGYIVLEEERRNSSVSNTAQVASCSKAICATVLAIASEESRQGHLPRKMTFEDHAFDFIPWAWPLSDPRKATITVKQLLNHTSGICPEALGAPNEGTWDYILGHSGDARTAKLAFDPGTSCGYSTHALEHAALVCETVSGKPYDQYAIEALFKPLGIEHWWFQFYDGGPKYGRHPSQHMGMPARDLARIAYCMVRNGRWHDKQVIPQWFVAETALPTHAVHGLEMRFKMNAENFSHGWELPARLTGELGRSGLGIPSDARSKPGSGGQLIAFVPSLDLVITRQTGSSGEWQFEEYLRRVCAAVTGP